MEIIFATNNQHKLDEINLILEKKIKIISLKDIDFEGEIPEEQNTIEGNARQKVEFIYEKYGKDCFADDSGLLVDVLNGAPGVHSARYAGVCDSVSNMDKLLINMKDRINRYAHFKTVICLIYDEILYEFEGIIEGEITKSARGKNGFGYDAIFQPFGYDQTFAEMSSELKNKISHRYIAAQKMKEFLFDL